jgi:hypothetical protein
MGWSAMNLEGGRVVAMTRETWFLTEGSTFLLAHGRTRGLPSQTRDFRKGEHEVRPATQRQGRNCFASKNDDPSAKQQLEVSKYRFPNPDSRGSW